MKMDHWMRQGFRSLDLLRLALAERVQALSFWHIALAYLAALTVAEVMTTLFEARVGMVLHGLLLVALFLLASLVHDGKQAAFVYTLALAPLIRLMSLSLPLPTFPFIYWYAIVGLPLLLAGVFAMRINNLKPRWVGLTFDKPFLQALIGLTGIGLGAIEYIILRPDPLIVRFELRQLIVPALILLIFTGFLEEFIFRGLMQYTSVQNFRWLGLVYVSTVFAVLHVGYRSWLDVIFVLLVALFFAVMAQLSGSIVGVTIAHGFTNIGLFLVFPFLIGSQAVNINALLPRQQSPAIALLAIASTPWPGAVVAVPGQTPTPFPTALLQSSVTDLPAFTATPAPRLSRAVSSPTWTSPPPTATQAAPTATQGAPTPTPLQLTPTPVLAVQPPYPLEVMRLVLVGIFRMGCDLEKEGEACELDEQPLHSVSLDAYLIDPYEVTNAQYASCLEAGACPPPASPASAARPDYFTNPLFASYPVVNVTWFEASAYCSWAGKSLPSEAQWEKAARRDKLPRIYPWGDRPADCTLANFTAEGGACSPDTAKTGAYPDGASPLGVYDLSGNVAEWVADWYQQGYYFNSPAANPAGPISGELKVARGGSFLSPWVDVRSASRAAFVPDFASPQLGFRCVAALP